ncbi:reverse transcriptase domain-containing protein [Tanacetum coccineum]
MVTVRVYAGYRCRTRSACPEHIPEYRTGMRIQTQAKSDVAVTKRRHGNHVVMQVVLIPKAKPDTVSEIPLLDHPLILTPEFGHGVTLGARLTRVASHLAVWPKYLKVTGAGICFNKLAPSVGPNFCTTKSLEWQLHNESPTCSVKPIRLSFDDEERPEEKLEEPKDLRNPYKEVLKSPFSRRIIRFSALNHRTPTNLKIYDGSTDPDNHITRFVGATNQGEWEMPGRRFCEIEGTIQEYKITERWVPGEGYSYTVQGKSTTSPLIWEWTREDRRSPQKGSLSAHTYRRGNRIEGTTTEDMITEQEATKEKAEEHKAPEGEEKVLVNSAFPEEAITIGSQFSAKCREQLIHLLKDNMDVFAWQSSDMAGIPRRLIRHTLNVNKSVPPVAQKRRVLGTEKSKVVTKEVEEWVKAGIVRPVKYPTWISNPVLVKKVDGTWRMCIDFKNLNAACPKDYYLLPEIDLKIEAGMGHPFKCLLDAYKGYHQMPFGLKNAGATYQRLVDSAFQAHLGRNLEAYVDDMVIKSKTEHDMIMDIAETFDNLRKMKCSFGAGEGKFLGYIVTSEGIRANPKKTKAIADVQSPKTLKEMQSLSGKLAALNRFISRSAERFLPFFETLKNITKENKDEYRWTEEAELAFQELKRLVLELPTHTTPEQKKALFIYLAASHEAVGGVPVANRKGKQTPIRYVSRTLHEAERNYAPLEKLALCLLHLSRRLRRYFEAHPIKVITDQPIKQILNKPEVSGKLAKYAVELGAYNITYIPRTTVKGQMNGEFVASSEGMAKYLAKAKEQAASFKKFSIKNIPGNQNQKADVLSKLASVAFNHLTKEILVEVLNAKSVDVEEVSTIVEEEGHNWMTPIMEYLEKGVWPKDENEARALRMKISQYVMEDGVLFKKSYLSPMLRCVWSPKGIDTDNGTQLVNDPFKTVFKRKVVKRWNEWIKQFMNTLVGTPQANGLVERANKSLMHGLKARLGRGIVGWVDELPNILWAHRTMLKTSNGETPFSLTYGSEAIIPAEIGMPTYVTIHFNEAQNEEEMRLNLDLSQERRETVAIREAKYKKKVEQYYNKRVRPRSFKVGDLPEERSQPSRKSWKVRPKLGGAIPGDRSIRQWIVQISNHG